MKRLILSISILAAGLLLAGPAHSGTVVADLQVSGNVIPTCSVQTTPVNFGDFVGVVGASANGDVTVNCGQGVPYHIALNAGLNFNGAFRRIANGTGAYMFYVLMKPNGTEWGDADYANTYMFATSLADTGTGAAQPHTVNGALYGATVPAGPYLDTVIVTIIY